MSPSIRANRMDRLARRKSSFDCSVTVPMPFGRGFRLRCWRLAQGIRTDGVADYLGVDGDYVARHLLKIPADRFRPIDLRNVSDLGRGFDLACSLEVAEHLRRTGQNPSSPLWSSGSRSSFLRRYTPPRRDGACERAVASYWAKLFANTATSLWIASARAIFGDSRVEWWYRQNISGILSPRQMSSRLHSGRRPL